MGLGLGFGGGGVNVNIWKFPVEGVTKIEQVQTRWPGTQILFVLWCNNWMSTCNLRCSKQWWFGRSKLTKRVIFFIWVFFHNHSRTKGLQGHEEGISLTPHYHFHPLHRHLDITRATAAESWPLYIGSSRTRTGILWFPSASR